MDATEEDVKQRIKAAVGWKECDNFGYLYAQGKSLRITKLTDVENSECWDFATVRVLMGSGALYVVKELSKGDCIKNDHDVSLC